MKEIMENLNDQAKVSTIGAELTEAFNNMNVETTTAKTTAEKLTADNEKLREANMNLFLKVGETTNKDKNDNQEQEDKTPKYEDLFNENGDLK
jgi:hypothetical protein